MTKYCRYCAHMIVGDWDWCEKRQRFMSDQQLKRVNFCKDFELNPIDALDENKRGYSPRQPKEEKT